MICPVTPSGNDPSDTAKSGGPGRTAGESGGGATDIGVARELGAGDEDGAGAAAGAGGADGGESARTYETLPGWPVPLENGVTEQCWPAAGSKTVPNGSTGGGADDDAGC